ncbi:SAM-dependent methyltransferase [Aestuariivirga litoralis]|uniref:SAM-dependent methyltransferase n=1 Tax=Aestuariivirga litoralis TaxID=2650924 RepID=UPI0018C5F69B|nr:cyclopropane-fatty-acyl-phospholipid synthase family protein [Aestuariivirga litoralis]MBG1231934.1 class I SAM-dependent methyltransferase [Aestuariivirga litoralis]
MAMLVHGILKKLIARGDLTLTDWKGRQSHYGDGTGPKVHIEITSASAARKIGLDPDQYLGEAFTSGEFKMRRGRIYDFLAIALENMGASSATMGKTHFMHNLLYKSRIALRRLDQRNSLTRSRHNVHSHYDLSGELYDLFLDKDRQYSCAYFESDDQTLEEAQLAKKRHIAAKMNIKPGMKILDIGSGWGGMGLYLAEMYGADVTGVTLSDEQFALSNARAKDRGLAHRVRFLLEDYRTLTQKFDRIVSVGMFEHVGVGHFPEFFKKCSELLKPDGTMLLHSIGRSDGPGATSAWTKKYIFPGGYIPALSEVMPQLERHGLYVTDIEILRLHYAKTLRHWLDRFMANRDKAAALYDERFCRLWEFYLASSETAFRFLGMNNFQIQFGRDQHYLPFTRDYIMAEEARLRLLEAKSKYYNAKAIMPPVAEAPRKRIALKPHRKLETA